MLIIMLFESSSILASLASEINEENLEAGYTNL